MTETRERILYTGAELFRRQGYAATGMKQIVRDAGATYGSVYHFFPGGKEQLGEEVLRVGGAFFLSLYELIADDAPDVVAATHAFFDGAAQVLVDTDFLDACPIATVAGEIASTHDTLRVAADDAFDSWIEAAAARYAAAGIPEARAYELGQISVVLIEGAFLLSRVKRDVGPMRTARDTLAALLSEAARVEQA